MVSKRENILYDYFISKYRIVRQFFCCIVFFFSHIFLFCLFIMEDVCDFVALILCLLYDKILIQYTYIYNLIVCFVHTAHPTLVWGKYVHCTGCLIVKWQVIWVHYLTPCRCSCRNCIALKYTHILLTRHFLYQFLPLLINNLTNENIWGSSKKNNIKSYLTEGSRLFLNKNIFEKCICNIFIFKVLLIVNQTLKGKIVLISTSVMGITFWADTVCLF